MDEGAPKQGRRYKLRLYNTDRREESAELARRIREAVRSAGNGDCDIEVIDVIEAPEEALAAHVFATPMLVRELPEPLQKVLGDLRDYRRVMMLLEIGPRVES